MYFKFFTLLLTLNIVTNSVLGIDDDQVLKISYEHYLQYYGVPQGKGLSVSNLVKCLDVKNEQNIRDAVNAVTVQDEENISLEEFKTFAKHLCEKYGFTANDFVLTQKEQDGPNKRQRTV